MFTYLIDNIERTNEVEKKDAAAAEMTTKGAAVRRCGGGVNYSGNSLVFEPRQQSLTHSVTDYY